MASKAPQELPEGAVRPEPPPAPPASKLVEPPIPPFLNKGKDLAARMEAGSTEQVNHPNHYGGDTTYETIKVLEAWLTPDQFIGALRFNAVKYLSRAGKKGGQDAQKDLAKAQWYTNYEMEFRRRKGLEGSQ